MRNIAATQARDSLRYNPLAITISRMPTILPSKCEISMIGIGTTSRNNPRRELLDGKVPEIIRIIPASKVIPATAIGTSGRINR